MKVIDTSPPFSRERTAIVLRAIASEQSRGGMVAVVYFHEIFSPEHARECGVTLETLLIARPRGPRERKAMIQMMENSGAITLLVLENSCYG